MSDPILLVLEQLKDKHLSKSFNFDLDIRTNYTEGSCHILANDLRQQHRGKVIVLSEELDFHWLLLLPDGFYIDIFGIYKSKDDLLQF
ncbi:Hypothetical protein HVR_LOCUS226 [uncultured virus]|nr:Hypothetical protein HVR_LOCUS226 [uncultured virus]